MPLIQDKSEHSESDNSEGEEEQVAPALPDDLPHVAYVQKRLNSEEMLAKSKDFYKLMNSRRSIRFFSPEKIPTEVIRNIVATAGTSPSGAHTEPWTYVVVRAKT